MHERTRYSAPSGKDIIRRSVATLTRSKDAISAASRRAAAEGARAVRGVSADDWNRLRIHGIAIALVLVAWAARHFLALGDSAWVFLLASAAVAISASVGGISAGAVATLTAWLVARLETRVAPLPAVVFLLEGLLISWVVGRLTARRQEQDARLAAANFTIGELQASERRGCAMAAASRRLEEATHEHAAIVLDRMGRVVTWPSGAARLYRIGVSEMDGQSVVSLFQPALSEGHLHQLLAEAGRRGVAKYRGPQSRGDETQFDADVELKPIDERGADGFTMLVTDRTSEEQRKAVAISAADLQRTLREEADLARQQLGALQTITDPSLNALPPAVMAVALLDRLRETLGADGVALVFFERTGHRVYSAKEGLQPRIGVDRRYSDARPSSRGRTVFIQNDAARVAEMSQVGWPDSVLSLLTVPVLQAGLLVGTVEVAHARARRATEWEIALVQVVAARAGGLTQPASYADAGAVA